MDATVLRQKLETRRDIYRAKRDKRSAFEGDTLNAWDKYDFAAEVVEYVAADLGIPLPDVDDRD